MQVTEQYIVDTIVQGQTTAIDMAIDIIDQEKAGQGCEGRKKTLAVLVGLIRRLLCYFPEGSTLPDGTTQTEDDGCYTEAEGKN